MVPKAFEPLKCDCILGQCMMYFTEYLIHSKEELLNTIRSYILLSKQNGNQYYHNLKAAKTDDAKPPLGGIL